MKYYNWNECDELYNWDYFWKPLLAIILGVGMTFFLT